MNIEVALTFVTGALVFGAGLELGLWHILAGPDRPNYPTSGKWKRRIMFCFMATLLYRGLELMIDAPYATGVSISIFQSALMLFAFFSIMLIDHLRNWLPARTHSRIRQLLHIASCPPAKGLVAARSSAMANAPGTPFVPATVVSPALAELALGGFKVSAPGDGPEVFH